MKENKTTGIVHLKDGLIDLSAGTAGGVASVFSGQPLDTIKVKMQTFPNLYHNWVVCLGNTWRMERIRGLYAGTVPALAANVSENAILFAAYGGCQKVVSYLVGNNSVKEMTPLENATAGSFAAFFAALALCPTELIKCKLQAQTEIGTINGKKRTSSVVCREMWNSGGIRSFYRGFVPTIIREMPGYFFFFGAYEFSRKALTPKGKTKEEIGLLRTALSGGIAGMALWSAIFPADVVKSRMQIGGSGRFSMIFLKILREEANSTTTQRPRPPPRGNRYHCQRSAATVAELRGNPSFPFDEIFLNRRFHCIVQRLSTDINKDILGDWRTFHYI